MANQIKYQVGFDIQQNDLNKLKSSLQQIKKINLNDIMKINNSDINSASNALREVQQDAIKVENALNKAFNTKLNTINIQTFNKELSSSNLTIEKIHQSFSRAGTAGQAAFNNLSAQILNTNVQLRQSSKLLDSMATSMANTVKWGITSSIFNTMTRSIQSAYSYAKNLDQSLTNIRIVTGDSADQMERFAQTANSAAKDLGRSTLDYTKAALSFYQQGLGDEEVQARATTTLKAQNITGMGSQMIDNLTAVWNGFRVSAEDAEEYVDKLAAVADTTASNMGQLATAISKVASAASNVGVDIDQLNGQISTVIATTRQAPESVGVAFKTIYARINDIKAGTDEAEISLGNYSSKMAQLGFNVLDATGHLRDTGEVIEEIGGKWQNLTREQQISLAQTMAGQRQYNNLIALFDNWDQYLQSVNTSLNAQGTLNEKNDRYLESLKAHMQQLGTEAQRTYDILFDEKAVKGWVDVLKGGLGIFNDFISGLGGGTNAFVYFGTIVTSIFNKQIAQAIQGVGSEIQRLMSNVDAVNTKAKVIEQIKSGLQIQYAGEGKNLGNTALTAQAQAAQKTLVVQKGLTVEQQKQAVQIQKQIGLGTQKIEDLTKEQNLAKQKVKTLTEELNFQKLSKEQIQLKNALLKEDYELTLQSKTALDTIGIALKTQTTERGKLKVTDEERANLLNRIKSEEDNIVAIYRDQNKEATNLENKVDRFQEKIEIVKRGIQSGNTGNKEFKAAWDEINAVVNKTANDQLNSITKTDTLLQNLEIDTSKLTEEEKKRLAVLLQQNDVLAEQGRKTLNLQTMIRGVSAVGMALTSIGGGLSTALAEGATAADKLNGRFTAIQGSIGAALTMIPGFGPALNIVWQGVSSIGKAILQATGVWEKFEDHLKSTSQRIQDLKDNLSKVQQTSVDYANDKENIQNIADEFQTLSAKAGKYNQSISSMSQEEQSRYRELVQQIINKNPELIAGYTAQGDAIIANNEAIKNTLDYLDQQYQKEMAILYAKQNVANAEKILQDQYKNAQEASKTQSQYNVEDQLQNARNNEINQARLLTSLQKSTPISDPYTGQITGYQMVNTDLGNLRQALLKLADNPDYENIYKDFEFCISEYNKIVNKSDVTLEEVERARGDLEHNLSTLQSKLVFLDWDNLVDDSGILSAGKIRQETRDIIQNNLNSLILDVDTLQSDLHKAEQQVEKEAAKINEDAESSSQELSAALISYRNYLFGALRYDPEYNSQFLVIRDQWGEQFTPQVQTLLESIMQDWVNTIGEDSKYLSEQNMTEAIVEDFNTFIENSFRKINPQDIISVQEQITKLLDKANEGEISGTEYQNKLHEIINKFVNSDSFKQMLQEDLKTNGNTDFSKLFLQSIFGQSINIGSVGEDIIADYTAASERIANRVSNTSKEMVQKLLSESGYTKQQLSALADQIEKEDLYFFNWFDYLNYARTFLGQTSQAIEEQGSKLSQGFDKVNNAIGKIQSGKELSYKDKLNLMEYLGLSPQDVENTDIILQKFKQQINSLQGLQRFEGLSKIFTDFDTLKQHFKDFNIEEFGDEYNALWQNILDSELEALNIDEAQLQIWAEKRGIIIKGSMEETEKAINAYKITQNIDELSDLANTVKQGGAGAEDALISLQAKLEQLTGQNYTEAGVLNLLDAIMAAAQDDGDQIQTVLDLLKQLDHYRPKDLSPVENFNEFQSTSTNLSGAYNALSTGQELTDEQSSALSELIFKNQQLAELSKQHGINSKQFLNVLNQIVNATEQQVIKQRELTVQELKEKEQSYRRQIDEIEQRYRSKIGEEQLQKIADIEKNIQKTTAQRLALEQQISAQWQKQADAAQNIDQLESAKFAGMDDQTFERNLDATAGREAKSLGLDEDEVLDYATALQECADQSDDLADSLETDRDASLQLAIAGKRLTRGIKDLAQNFDQYNQQINSDNIEEQAQAFGHLRDAMGDVLNINGDLLSKDFLTNNLQDMQLAAQGDIDAIDRLRQAAADDIIQQCLVELQGDEQVKQEVLNLSNQVESYLSKDFQLGVNLDDADFVKKCNQLVSAANMTEQQIQGYFNSLGFDPKISYIEESSEPMESISSGTVTIGDEEKIHINVPYNIHNETVTKVKVPRIESLTKTGGGSHSGAVTRTPAPSSSKSGNKGGGKGGNKGGGSKGSGSKPDKSQKDLKKSLEDQRDLYHDINIQLEQTERNLKRIEKMQDRLYGKQLLDNLAKQKNLLQQQRSILERKQKIQQDDLKQQQQTLKNLGATFDQYGNITNYMSIIGQKQNKVNALIAEENKLIKDYNKTTNKEAKQALSDLISEQQKKVKTAEDDLKNTQDKIKGYDKLREDIEDVVDQIEELTQQEIELNIKEFRMEVQIRLKLGEAERDWNKFRKQVLEKTDFMDRTNFDDIFAGMSQNFNDLYSYFDVHGSVGTIETLTNQLLNTRKEIEQIDSIGKSAIYGDNKAKAMQDLQNDLKQLMEQMEDIEKLIDDIDQAYLDTIDDVEEQFGKQIEDYEYINELVQHNMDLLSLLYGDKNYDAMNRYYQTLQRNNINQLDSLKRQRSFWKEQWDAAVARGDTNAAEKFKENYKKAITDLNKLIEQSAKTIQEKYSNSINKIFDELDKKLSNGRGTDYLQTQWDLINKNADEYLDTINAAFAVQQTERKYRKALDDTKSIKNQQALKKLMNEQLDILKNKEKISQYDVDRAEKVLQLEQARIALEQAQAAKTSLRLKRDAQGNYSYQYAADSASIDDAQSNYDSAFLDLHNLDADQYKTNQEKMLSAYQEYIDKRKEILEKYAGNQEEQIKRVALLDEEYGEYVNDRIADNFNIRLNLMESTFKSFAHIYQADVANYQQMAEDEKQILMENLVPTWNTGIEQMAETIAGEGGLLPACEQGFEEVTDATHEYQDELDELATAAGINLDDVQQGIDDTAEEFENLVQKNDDLLLRMDEEISTVNSLKGAAEALAAQYGAVYTAAKQAASAIHQFIQAQQEAAATANGYDNSGSNNINYNNSSSNNSNNSNNKNKSSSNSKSSGNSGGSGGNGGSGSGTSGSSGSNRSSSQGSSYVGGSGRRLLMYYATGGYTGEWGDEEGRLAFLHQKELVLNKEDTKNILHSVDILRNLVDSAKGNIFTKLSDINRINAHSYDNTINNELEQDVHIEASFPNVNSKREIEEAFSDLVNLAAQRTMR